MRDKGKTIKLEWLRQKLSKLIIGIDDKFNNCATRALLQHIICG